MQPSIAYIVITMRNILNVEVKWESCRRVPLNLLASSPEQGKKKLEMSEKKSLVEERRIRSPKDIFSMPLLFWVLFGCVPYVPAFHTAVPMAVGDKTQRMWWVTAAGTTTQMRSLLISTSSSSKLVFFFFFSSFFLLNTWYLLQGSSQ